MLNLCSSMIITVPILLPACASGPPFIDQMQPTAMWDWGVGLKDWGRATLTN